MAPSFDWWAKESRRGTPVVVKMENPNWSMVELEAPSEDDFLITDSPSRGRDKARGKNAKQLTWVLLLKAHKAAGCLTSIASTMFGLAATVRRRVASGRTDNDAAAGGRGEKENPAVRSRFYGCIKVFLWLSVVLLGFEVAAYFKGWHFGAPHLQLQYLWTTPFAVKGVFDWVYSKWVLIRVEYLAPPLQFLANACIILFLIQSLDRLILCLGCFWIKFKKIKPIPKAGALDLESGEKGFFPMVLVQIPMCNEKEVYQQSIAAVCNLDWPKSKLLIQILDDSDDPTTRLLIKEEVQKWQHEGARIVYRHRVIRDGYKAGNLKSAMNCSYVKDYEFVAIFDADFQPNPDFLTRTVPHFKDNDDLGLVQARWSFVNKDENLLTRLQNINLAFHFEVEQQVNGVFLSFFGFNGTAGVWRIKALEDAGGWLERTTVEDMDIAVRAHLHGWKFIFLNDIECHYELPESYEAYRKQQYRWHSGPMQLFHLCLPIIIYSKISVWKKSNLIFLFFLLRKLILPFYSFTLFCPLAGIEPFVTIHHFDIPHELEERYEGWLSPESQEDFLYFAEICFKSFGDRVKNWVTFNEPNLIIILSFRFGTYPPCRCSRPFGNCSNGNSEKEPFIAAHNMILSHAAAVYTYRTKYQKEQRGRIGIVLHAPWFEPISNSTADKAAAERAQTFFLKWILDPIIFGKYPVEMENTLGSLLPKFSTSDKEKLKMGLDFIGLNHYDSFYVKDCIYSPCEPGIGVTWTEGSYLETTERNGVPIGETTPLDWLNAYPRGMEEILLYVMEIYHKPMIVTENGYGTLDYPNMTIEELIDDAKRVEYMSSYLDALLRAKRKGADVRGYFVWSFLDNFEWLYGYTARFGLYLVDRLTLNRTRKTSATWYQNFIATQKQGLNLANKALILPKYNGEIM